MRGANIIIEEQADSLLICMRKEAYEVTPRTLVLLWDLEADHYKYPLVGLGRSTVLTRLLFSFADVINT